MHVETKEEEKKKTICLVGNGPSVCEKEYGDFIDSHDIVIRFNNAPLITKYTGTKTDVWFGYMKPHELLHRFKYVVIGIWGISREAMAKRIVNIQKACLKDHIPYSFLSEGIIRTAYQDLGLIFPEKPKPTGGYLALKRYLMLYPKGTFSLIGFDFYNMEKNCFYWDDKNTIEESHNAYRAHIPQLEKKRVEMLCKQSCFDITNYSYETNIENQ